ncbi:MAG: phosphate ABC transporter permease PstA [Planctomycetes bacterium]|nr:phosphate ABC transporter permease PstA [Planctomycetota bacterium]
MNDLDLALRTHLAARHRLGRVFGTACMLSTWLGIGVLIVLLCGVLWQAVGWLNWSFLTSFDSRHPEQAGILAGLWGSLWLILFTTLFSVPAGVGAALYLEEYSSDTWLRRLIQVNLSNLAGVPSIVYGILGLTVFVRMFGLFGSQPKVVEVPLIFANLQIPLPLGRTVISAALTLSLLILPVVIVAAQEALRAVPASIRQASYALGATQWQTTRDQVLPVAMPGILTGVILAISRAIGETAPLVMIGALTYVAFTPGDISSPVDVFTNPDGIVEAPFDTFTALPIQVFNWVSRPKTEYQHVAAAGIIVLLVALLVMNAAAILMRHKFQKRIRW